MPYIRRCILSSFRGLAAPVVNDFICKIAYFIAFEIFSAPFTDSFSFISFLKSLPGRLQVYKVSCHGKFSDSRGNKFVTTIDSPFYFTALLSYLVSLFNVLGLKKDIQGSKNLLLALN